MKERPILFSAPMVRALLTGTKTQTRRIAIPKRSIEPMTDECPYGQPGDRLWVREAWRVEGKHTDSYSPSCIEINRAHFGRIDYEASITWNKSMYGKLRPSIHMPRWASRITLEVTGVRVERLQDISEADARAEGISRADCPDWHATTDYRALWESINGPGSWDANPWVWVVEFRRVPQ